MPLRPYLKSHRAPAASVALHAGLLALLLQARPPQVAPMRLPGTHNGSRLELTYSPGRAPAPSSVPDTHTRPRQTAIAAPPPKITPPARSSAPATPNAAAPSAAHPDSATGLDALGDGDVSIALVTFYPRPTPDLSPLAHGAAGDVILDVVIDAGGKISDIKVTHSLSPTIDQTVIATVQQWTFQPASRNGQPIASEQELHFHYERG